MDQEPPQKITVTPSSYANSGDKAVQTKKKGPGHRPPGPQLGPADDDDDDFQLTSYANGCCA